MNPVDSLGMRVIGSPVTLALAVPPNPHVPPGGGRPPGRKTKQKRSGALHSISKLVAIYKPQSLTDGTGNEISIWKDTGGRHFDADPIGGTNLTQRYDPSIASAYAEGGGNEGFGFTLGADYPRYVADTQQYTIYAVFRPTGSDDVFFSLSEATGDSTARFGFSASGKFRLSYTYAGNAETTQTYALNQWHYVVIIRKSGSTVEVWVDGKKSSLVTVPTTSVSTIYHYHIGSGWYQIFGGYPRMTGDLAEVAWWGKRVSTAERQTIEGHAKYKFKL